MNTQDLYDGWSLTAVAGPVPADLVGRRVRARVPGTSHTALLEAGLIPDPYVDRHEEDLAWMRRTDWAYERDLDLTPAARRCTRSTTVASAVTRASPARVAVVRCNATTLHH